MSVDPASRPGRMTGVGGVFGRRLGVGRAQPSRPGLRELPA